MAAPSNALSAGADRVILAAGLARRFGSFMAVDNVSLSLRRGEVLGVLGANGAGKTTTIRMLCGTLPPSAGRIEVAGVDMVRRPRHARGLIGYVSQRFALYGDLQVRENLSLQAGLYNVSGRRKKQRIEWALANLKLKGFERTLAAELPLGYKRRLAFAAALLHDPQVLFLDEPTSGMDPAARQHFWELIYDLAESGIGILVTTHYMDEALFCDRIALMHAGSIIAEDTPQNLQKMPLKSALLELRTAQSRRCAQLLKRMPAVREVISYAGQLRIRLHPGFDVEKTIAEITGRARGERIAIDGLGIIEAELEDVFVDMLEQVGAGQGS